MRRGVSQVVSALTLAALRQWSVARTLFRPTDLQGAVDTLGFVQADPIRAPARAQDLTLRHRVVKYVAGDLERQYPSLRAEEAFFVNYGFVTPDIYALMHPRGRLSSWPKRRRAQAEAILEWVRERREAHPRDVDAHFAHGRVTNYWGGSSNATTHMLDQMHYLGVLRVVRREGGIRIYGARADTAQPVRYTARDIDRRLDALVDVVVRKYAPLPSTSASALIRRLRYAAPQWSARVGLALRRALQRLATARIDGVDWYWPADESPVVDAPERVCLLAPFDPLVWDRRRFELFWGWPYRFEAYTPVAKRQWGYYAMPLLWRDRVVGWATVGGSGAAMTVTTGYVSGRAPRERGFAGALEAEVERLRSFLGPGTSDGELDERARSGADDRGGSGGGTRSGQVVRTEGRP